MGEGQGDAMKWGPIIGGVVVLSLAGLATYGFYQRNAAALWAEVARNAKDRAGEEARRAEEAEKWAAGYKSQADAFRGDADRLSRELADLKRTIPEPKPVPASAPAIAEGLMAGGFSVGLKVYDDHEPSRLNRADGEKAWAWNQSAAMVPGLQASLGKAEEMAAMRYQESQALRFVVTHTEEARDDWKRSSEAQKARAEALDSTIAAIQKNQKAERVQKWLAIAGGVAAGYVAGKALR